VRSRKTDLSTGANDQVTGEEVYQLRCAYLHEGSELQSHKKEISAAIEKLKFTISKPYHCTKEGTEGTIVWLDVPTFCEDICDHVESWETKILSKDLDMKTRAEKLHNIYIIASPSGIPSTTAFGKPTVTRSESPPA
jgi:hypothetical protein